MNFEYHSHQQKGKFHKFLDQYSACFMAVEVCGNFIMI